MKRFEYSSDLVIRVEHNWKELVLKYLDDKGKFGWQVIHIEPRETAIEFLFMRER